MYRCIALAILSSWIVVTAEGWEHGSQVTPQHTTRKCEDTLQVDEAKLADAGALPINVTLEVPQESIIPGENFPIRFTIQNPHPFAIYFSHVGYEQPHLYAATGDEELCRVGRAGGVNPDAVISPVLEPDESATAELLIFIRHTGLNRFEPEGGYTLRLRAGGAIHGYRIDNNTRERVTFRCMSNEVQIPVRVMTPTEEQARIFLQHRREQIAAQLPGDLVPWAKQLPVRIEFYQSFLERFGDTPYAKEVRVVLGSRVREHIAEHRKEKEVVDEYEPLLVQCIMDCLAQGPAYAPVVHHLGLLDHFGRRGQWNDMLNVIEALLKLPEQDRTVDSVLANIVRRVVPIEVLQEHGLPKGALTKRLEAGLTRAVERCLSWEGYRAVGFGENTYTFLSRLERWDLVEQAAQQTLQAAERPNALISISGRRYAVREEDVVAARNALEQARKVRSTGEQASNGNDELSRVVRADIVQHSPLSIKPCQSVTVVIELESEHPLSPLSWRRVTHQISQKVRVNGREFRNRLSSSMSSLNDAADFRLCENRMGDAGARSVQEVNNHQIIATMFLNGIDREYLFGESGQYQVEFIVGDEILALEIHVNEPTAEERRIIKAINDVPILLFLIDPEDSQYATVETLTLIESLARHDTAYKKMLSLARGLAHQGTRITASPTSPDFQEKRLAVVRQRYQWLAPFCSEKITSRLEATAALKCGLLAGMLATDMTHSKQAEKYLAQRDELWRKVATSPMAFGEAARAREYMAKLETEKREANSAESERQDSPN